MSSWAEVYASAVGVETTTKWQARLLGKLEEGVNPSLLSMTEDGKHVPHKSVVRFLNRLVRDGFAKKDRFGFYRLVAA